MSIAVDSWSVSKAQRHVNIIYIQYIEQAEILSVIHMHVISNLLSVCKIVKLQQGSGNLYNMKHSLYDLNVFRTKIQFLANLNFNLSYPLLLDKQIFLVDINISLFLIHIVLRFETFIIVT